MSSDSEVSPEVIDGLHDRDHDIDDEHDTTGIVKGDSIDGKIMYVWNLLRSNPEYRLRLRFMLISETVILRVYKGRLYEYRQLKPLTVIRDMTWNRGKILETFIKLEIMTTEKQLELSAERIDITVKYSSYLEMVLWESF